LSLTIRGPLRGCASENLDEASSLTMPNRDVYRVAGVLVNEYGAKLPPEMAERRCEALSQVGGDLDELVMWRRILCAVKEIVRTERDVGERVN
jgi:hypothetical protein